MRKFSITSASSAIQFEMFI